MDSAVAIRYHSEAARLHGQLAHSSLCAILPSTRLRRANRWETPSSHNAHAKFCFVPSMRNGLPIPKYHIPATTNIVETLVRARMDLRISRAMRLSDAPWNSAIVHTRGKAVSGTFCPRNPHISSQPKPLSRLRTSRRSEGTLSFTFSLLGSAVSGGNKRPRET